LGWFTRRLLIRAEALDNPLAMCAYAIVFSLTLTMFGQGFGPGGPGLRPEGAPCKDRLGGGP